MAAAFGPLLLGVTRELTPHNGESNRYRPVHHVDLQSASTAPPNVWRAAQDPRAIRVVTAVVNGGSMR
jgi:hypothetical protein